MRLQCIGIAIGNRDRFAGADKRQTDKANRARLTHHVFGQRDVAGKTLRIGADLFAQRAQYAAVEGVEGAGQLIQRHDLDRPAAGAQLLPGLHFASKGGSQLLGA